MKEHRYFDGFFLTQSVVAFFMIYFFFLLTPKHNNFSYVNARQALNLYFMHHETLSQVDERFAGGFFVLLYIKYSLFLHKSDFSYQKFTVTAAQQYERTVTHAETKN